jgi:CheY-like chemotaxis protein
MNKAATELGYQVDCTDDPSRFLDISRSHPPDLQIVDHKLPGIEDKIGIRDGLELVAVSAAESKHVPTVFFTNWSGDCVKRLEEFDPRLVAAMVDKPMHHSQAKWRTKLAEAIDNLTAQPSFEQPEPLGIPTKCLESEFFAMSPAKLHALPEDSRDALEIKASDDLYEYLSSAWEVCDDDWLMVCRVDDVILIIDRGTDAELPTVEAVRDLEVERDSGVMTIGRPAFLEEVGTLPAVKCTPKEPRNWTRYPHVRLIVGPNERDFHLDTGSAKSYISREFIAASLGAPTGNPKPSKIWNLGMSETRLQQPVEIELYVVGPRGNVRLSLAMQAIKNWKQFDMLNPPCLGQLCPESEGSQCGRRLGLIGRNLLYAVSKGTWQFEPASGQFYASGL